MSSVWLCIPSKRPPEEANRVLAKWRERGYKTAVWRDADDNPVQADICHRVTPYPGYAVATNELIKLVSYGHDAEWFVIGGDDVEPDAAHSAEEIAWHCREYFLHMAKLAHMNQLIVEEEWATLGVMQPTGDRWGDTPTSRRRYGENRGAYIDRVCGSAWLGREFCRRINNGRGPLWPEFTHMYVDEALQRVAEKLGILWQRRDLIQLHQHWGRKEGADVKDIPDFLRCVNTPGHWKDSKAIFERLAASGFAEYAELA